MQKILNVNARQILDSRGNPTIEVEVISDKGCGRAMVPSGASTGAHEAVELRDNGKSFHGLGVQKAVKNVNVIIKKNIVGKTLTQGELDHILIKLDGTKNKKNLGANAILGVSVAACKALVGKTSEPLAEYIAELAHTTQKMPMPFMNVINGGKHAGREFDVQEHMWVPIKTKNFNDALQASVESYQTLRLLLKKKCGARATLVGDEGGFSPDLDTAEQRLSLMEKALDENGVKNKFAFALDCAASEFYNKKTKKYQLGKKKYDTLSLIEYYKDLIRKFDVISIEDPFDQEDWKSFSMFTKKMNGKVQVIGDDLLCTNRERIEKAIKEKACNTLLLKMNQIGTLTETIEAAKLTLKHDWKVMVSHRSGETEDSFIADLAVGLGTGQCKFGAPCRSERTAKYNQLLRLAEHFEK